MVSLNITVNTPGDFANYFSLNTDPERTYIGADLGDGYDSAYTCVESADVQAPSDRKYYPNITHDMSPDISVKTYDVKGQITIATNLDGTAGTTGIVGITASVAVGDKTVTATSDSQGYYTLSALPEGTYTVTFSGSTTVDRTATLVVSADKADSNGLITVSAVPICICDYVKNGEIDGFDKINFMKYLTNDEYDVYHDIVANSKVDGFDKVQFQSFLNQKIVYAQAEL
ncbi:MAG: SdrD B-like domain-containing protein, partial [Eubacterium sp.]